MQADAVHTAEPTNPPTEAPELFKKQLSEHQQSMHWGQGGHFGSQSRLSASPSPPPAHAQTIQAASVTTPQEDDKGVFASSVVVSVVFLAILFVVVYLRKRK